METGEYEDDRMCTLEKNLFCYASVFGAVRFFFDFLYLTPQVIPVSFSPFVLDLGSNNKRDVYIKGVQSPLVVQRRS